MDTKKSQVRVSGGRGISMGKARRLDGSESVITSLLEHRDAMRLTIWLDPESAREAGVTALRLESGECRFQIALAGCSQSLVAALEDMLDARRLKLVAPERHCS